MELCQSLAEAKPQSPNSQSMKADSAYLLNARVMNVISRQYLQIMQLKHLH